MKLFMGMETRTNLFVLCARCPIFSLQRQLGNVPEHVK